MSIGREVSSASEFLESCRIVRRRWIQGGAAQPARCARKALLEVCDTAHRRWFPPCAAFEDRDRASNWTRPWGWLEARSGARLAQNNQRRLGPFGREGFCWLCLARKSAS